MRVSSLRLLPLVIHVVNVAIREVWRFSVVVLHVVVRGQVAHPEF